MSWPVSPATSDIVSCSVIVIEMLHFLYDKVATRGEPLLEPVDPDARSKNTENYKKILQTVKQYVRETMPSLEDTPAMVEPCLYTVGMIYELFSIEKSTA